MLPTVSTLGKICANAAFPRRFSWTYPKQAPIVLFKAVISMGDKSPKAKDKAKKQHSADKDQKHAAAVQKAKPPAPGAGKKGS